jgi:hypothetical protein
MGMIQTWGSTAAERAESFPCDRQLDPPYQSCFRAVDVAAPVDLTFRWICQLRVAPYSYDWIDNLGRRSPRQRDPRNEQLAIGQRVMTIFRVAEFEIDRQITLVIDRTKVFGNVAVTYVVRPAPSGSRIVVKLSYHVGACSLRRWFLPPGDFIMMRKQLLTLKRLAEHEHERGPRH